MPDYVYLLENRLSADQRHAVRLLRDAAQEAGMILFLTGDAVRDLSSGHAVRELEVTIHGNALKLKKTLEKSGAKVWGEDADSRTLFLCFPGTVRVDVVSAHRREYPKPGKPVYHWASIQEDLRRRDFTANAMAISLNEGSFGLLMDPLNGAADIESRTVRLVSNYGFLEEPSLLIRAIRYRARLAWEFDPKTQSRYENAKAEGVIEHLSPQARGEELEQIGHEEDALKVLEALDAEGWMRILFPAWTAAKADAEGLKALHEQAVELQLQGVHPDTSAAQMQLITAGLAPKEIAALKKLLIRPGFVEEWNSLDALASGFAKALMTKEHQTPSKAFKFFRSYDPEAVLWLGFTTKDGIIKERYHNFLKVWPEARQRIPHALMQEMRITPDLANYQEILEAVFLELIDGKLNTPEEMRAFLEPYSPPAPPPQVVIKRSRGRRGAEPKMKEQAFDEEEEEEEESEEGLGGEGDLDDIGGEDEEISLGIPMPKGDLEEEDSEPEEEEESDEEPEPAPPARHGGKAGKEKPAKGAAAAAPAKPAASGPEKATAAKAAAQKPAPAPAPAPAAKTAPKPQSPTPAKPAAPAPKGKPAAPPKAQAKPAKPPVPAAKPVKAAAAKAPSKPAAKTAVKPPAKAAARPAAARTPAKPAAKAKPGKPQKPSKAPAKKPAAKPAKKR
jgi:tRNA nucleotidyltransferase (CCA-adding enzyme)